MNNFKEILKNFPKDENAFDAFSEHFFPKLHFPAGEIAVIGARPRTGRTLFMLYLFKTIFEQKGGNHLYISNEENEELLFSKLMTTVTQENIYNSQKKIKNDTSEFPILKSENCSLHHHFGSWEELKKKIEDRLRRQRIDYLYIDKIQGLYSDMDFKNRDEEIRHIILEIKILSAKYQFAAIIASNLSKNVDKRHCHYPHIYDLKDGGALEDLSDLILLLFRLETYGILENENGQDMRGILQVLLEKNRHGSLDAHILTFDHKIPCIKSNHPIDIQIA